MKATEYILDQVYMASLPRLATCMAVIGVAATVCMKPLHMRCILRSMFPTLPPHGPRPPSLPPNC